MKKVSVETNIQNLDRDEKENALAKPYIRLTQASPIGLLGEVSFHGKKPLSK
jgi:hypothetical protein